MIITSRENKIFKLIYSLKTKRGRDENALFIIEGLRSVSDAMKRGAKIKMIACMDGFKAPDSACPIYTFAPKLFKELSETITPQGIIAVCESLNYSEKDIKESENSCIIMCENVQDPGNIGTIIRTAHASFCDGVVLTKGSCDLYNPKIVRSTMAGIFSVPIITGKEASDTILYYKNKGYKIVSGALADNSTDLYSADLCGKVLIIIGNEGNGVTEDTLKMCDSIVKIPMKEDAESLNASVAGAVLLYEHLRRNYKKIFTK